MIIDRNEKPQLRSTPTPERNAMLKTAAPSTPRKPLDLAQFEGFTPGPWHVWKTGAYNYVMNGGGYTLAKLDPAFAYKKSHGENAALIAAAPALLSECKRQREQIAVLREALKDSISQMAQDTPGIGSRDYEVALPYTLKKARAALAATEGTP